MATTGGTVLDQKTTDRTQTTTAPTTVVTGKEAVTPTEARIPRPSVSTERETPVPELHYTHVSRREWLPVLVIGVLVMLMAGIVALVMLSVETTSESTMPTTGMSQEAWQAYRSGERASMPVIHPSGMTQEAWLAYRSGERAGMTVIHPSGMTLDAWAQYRAGERM